MKQGVVSGFRDLLLYSELPKIYSNNFISSSQGITHTIDSEGHTSSFFIHEIL